MSTDLSDQLRESLNRRAASTPPPSFQANTLIHRGRRARRNRQIGTVAAAALAVAIVVGSVVALTWNVSPKPAPPVQPAPSVAKTTMRLPAIGPCGPGDWIFTGNVSQRGNQRLTLVPKPASVPLKDLTYDFDGDGKPERLQKFVCTLGSERVEGVEALTQTGPTSMQALGAMTSLVSNFLGSYSSIESYKVGSVSIGGGPARTVATLNEVDFVAWDNSGHQWAWVGG